MKKTSIYFLTIIGLASILSAPSAVLAQVAPPPGVVLPRFSVLGNSGVTGSAGVGTVVNGDVGSSPTASITNFVPVGCCSTAAPPFIVHFANDLIVQQAHTDLVAAYGFLAAQGPGTVLSSNQLNGRNLTTGIYSFPGPTFAADLAANGTLTLTGPGIFIFQVGADFTANVGSNIVLAGANPCNIYWRVGTSATLNGVSFSGNVLADASITVGVGSNVTGKTLAGAGPTGAVTMAGGPNTIGGCAVAPAVACPLITVNPATLPNGSIGSPYSQTLSGSGGVAPYTFSVGGGALPNGLLLNSLTGVIAGTPTVAGPFNFMIQAADVNGCLGSRVFNVAIAAACPDINVNPASLPNIVIGAPYNQSVSGSAGLAPYTFAVTAGALPNGLVLNNATGAITGTPTTPGTSNFTITATDANGCSGTRTFAVGFTAGGGPTLDVVGLSILMALLVGAGLFVMNRLSL